MKRILIFTCMLFIASFKTQTTTVFNEDFETTSTTISEWSVIDGDGDGKNWGISDANNYYTSRFVYSLSWQDSVLTPDNVAISPSIALPIGGTLNLSFKIGAGKDNAYYAENYSVYVIPSTSTFLGTETPLLTEQLTNANAGVYKTVNIDISSFAGQTVKIIFRHYNCSGQWFIALDDVVVTNDTAALKTTEVDSKKVISIYPNPTSDYINIKSEASIKNVKIYDASGKMLANQTKTNFIDVRNLSKGNYILNIETEKGIESIKFIKK